MPHTHPELDQKSERKPKRVLVYAALTLVTVVLVAMVLKGQFQNAFSGVLPDAVVDFSTIALGVVIGAFPFVVLGVAFSALTQTFLPERVWDFVRAQNVFVRRFIMTFVGAVFPVCECGNLPMSRALMVKGFSASDAVVVLIAAPILNPITILATSYVFGWDSGVLWGRIIFAVVASQAIAAIFARFSNQDSLFTDRFNIACKMERHEGPHRHEDNTAKAKRAIEIFSTELFTMMIPLLIGGLVAAVIQTVIPTQVLSALGENLIVSILAMLALGFIISLCSNVDSFFALSLSNNFGPGALTAFLTFGAVADVKMITLLKTTYSWKGTGIIVVVSLMTAFVVSLGVSAFA